MTLASPAFSKIPQPAIKRWEALRYVEPQARFWADEARFQIACAGRRSGKSEIAKRKVAVRAASEFLYSDSWFVVAAPTHKQAKRIAWADMKLLTRPFWARRPSESELTIYLENGARITVLGLDAPDRIEGSPLNGIWIDEFGNIKEEVWKENVRPMLTEREGWAILTGVPEGRNHYYDLAMKVQSESPPDWSYHHWISALVLPAGELEAAKREFDERTFQQEFEASFVDIQGRAYYKFSLDTHLKAVERVPNQDLHIALDFNVEPGCAEAIQELDGATCSVDEVYIKTSSNTEYVCGAIIEKWGDHQGRVYVYGDPSGGARGTAKVRGTDWDLVRAILRAHFRERFVMRVAHVQPSVRDRINAVNSRMMSFAGDVRYYVNPKRCPELVKDWEGVQVLPGTAGELDKTDKRRTHFSDAVGYYIHHRFPVTGRSVSTAELNL